MANSPKIHWTENELDLQARINALEYLLKQFHWQFVLDKAGREPIEPNEDPTNRAVRDLKAFRERALEQLRNISFKNVDPTLSDHTSALVREHVERVLGELIAGLERN